MSISVRGQQNASTGALFSRFFDVISNLYDKEKNPKGYINLGSSENVGESDLCGLICSLLVLVLDARRASKLHQSELQGR